MLVCTSLFTARQSRNSIRLSQKSNQSYFNKNRLSKQHYQSPLIVCRFTASSIHLLCHLYFLLFLLISHRTRAFYTASTVTTHPWFYLIAFLWKTTTRSPLQNLV